MPISPSPALPDSAADAQARAFIDGLSAEAERHAVPFRTGQATWRRFGRGPALVLLHGGHGRWLHWARNIRAWAAHCTVWVPDLPGYGNSDAPSEPTLDSLVEATKDTLHALLGAAPVALVGFSFGALVAASLAARMGGAVTHLALLGPGGHGGTRRPRGDLRPWREAATRQDATALAEVMRHNLLMHMLHEPDAVDALALRIHTDACLRTRFHSKSISRAGGLGRALEAWSGPLLLAWGEHDVTADPEPAGHALAAGRKRCSKQIVPGAGHWVAYERADDVNARLLDWLRAEAASRAP